MVVDLFVVVEVLGVFVDVVVVEVVGYLIVVVVTVVVVNVNVVVGDGLGNFFVSVFT